MRRAVTVISSRAGDKFEAAELMSLTGAGSARNHEQDTPMSSVLAMARSVTDAFMRFALDLLSNSGGLIVEHRQYEVFYEISYRFVADGELDARRTQSARIPPIGA
jgi:hypothetical protein